MIHVFRPLKVFIVDECSCAVLSSNFNFLQMLRSRCNFEGIGLEKNFPRGKRSDKKLGGAVKPSPTNTKYVNCLTFDLIVRS